MNNNQPQPYQKYSPLHSNNPIPTSYNTNPIPQSNLQPQFYTNTLNLPKNDYSNNTYFSPNDNHSINRNKIDRAMYSSTIQPTLPNKTFNIGKLQTMARLVPNTQKSNHSNYQSPFQYKPVTSPNQQRTNFINQYQNTNNNNNNKLNDFDRFPSFNLNQQHPSSNQHVPNNNYQPQPIQQQGNQQINNETLTPQQKRRRQILAIKQQLDAINKKMQNSNLSKKYTSQIQKNDSRPQQFIPNNNYLNPTNNQIGTNQTNLTTGKRETSPMPTGLTFTKNSNQLETFQRNKGMVAQSMIVSTEPSPGYKYQSIFDKYDSLKKPVYETTNNVETNSSQGLLLDKFVNKGPGSLKNNNPTQTTNNNLNNIPNPVNFQTKTDRPKYNYPFSNSNQTFSNNFSTTSTSSTQSSTSSKNQGIVKGNTNETQPSKEQPTMFKKKKANFAEEIQIQTIISDTINTQNNTFKTTYQQTIVTKAMKNLKIQESVQFKRQDFVVGKKLGKGQFGQVMLVQHKITGFICGMKVMEKKQIRDQKYQGQIARQLSIQFYLAHRNIAPLYGYFQDEKNVYLLVEYCTGGQLLEMLRKNRRMEEPQVSRVIRQIIEGIDYIHKELIIHRDIKPQNILFNFVIFQLIQGVAKICDFGWAVYKGHGMRKTASVGSPLYYSPEIVMGVEYDEKIDIWDIGMMTYECLLGKIPFRIYSELDLNRIVEDQIKFPQYIETSDDAKDFILKIMKKKPEERMEIREMLRHPFITKYPEPKLPIEVMKDFKEVLS